MSISTHLSEMRRQAAAMALDLAGYQAQRAPHAVAALTLEQAGHAAARLADWLEQAERAWTEEEETDAPIPTSDRDRIPVPLRADRQLRRSRDRWGAERG